MTKIVSIFQDYRNNLSPEKVNAQRQKVVDLARGLAVLFMVLVHVLETYGVQRVRESNFGYVIEFFGSPPAAPVFMLLMGVSLAFSNRISPRALAIRGVKIFILGYILSFFRFFLPMFVGLKNGIFTMWDLKPYSMLALVIEVDILQFAGLSLVFLGSLEWLKIRKAYYPAIALVLSLASPHLWGIELNIPVFNYLFDPLWGDAYYVYFPFFSWIFYPLIGAYMGNHLIRAKDKTVYYRGLTYAGLILLVFGTLVSITDMQTHIGDYWRHGIGGNLWITGFVLVWLALLFFLLKRLPPSSAILDRLYFWSKNVTAFYCIHWMIIGWGTLLLGFEESSLKTIIIIMVVVTILCDRLTHAWTLLKHRQA